MCVQCYGETIKASAAAGGASMVQPLLAAGLAAVGAKSLGAWLSARQFRWVTHRRIALATSSLVAATVVAAATLL